MTKVWWTGTRDELAVEAVELEDEGFDEAARSLVLIGIEQGVLEPEFLAWWDHAEELEAMVEEPSDAELQASTCYACPRAQYGCCPGRSACFQ